MSLKLLFPSALGSVEPFLVFFGAVMVSAWYGGVGPGLAAAVGAALVSAYFFLPPYYSWAIADPQNRARLGAFLLEATLISALSGALHAARLKAEASQQRSEVEMAKRRDLFEISEARRRSAEALGSGLRALTQALDPDVVAQRIVDRVCALLGALTAAVYRIEPGSEDLVALTVSGDTGPAFGPQIVFPRGTGAVGLAVSSRRPFTTPDVLSDPRIWLTAEVRARIAPAPYRAVLAIPLMIQDSVVGALGVGDRAEREFSIEEIELAQAFADQAAVALENARLFAQAQRERRRLETLYTLARRLAATDELDRVLTVIVDEASRLLGAEVVAVRLVQGDELVLRAQTEAAARQRLPERIRRDDSLESHEIQEAGLHATTVRLAAAERVLGRLVLYGSEPRTLSGDEVALLTAFADQAAASLERAGLASDRQRAEAALRQSEKLTSLGQLVAGVAHELNNSLAVVLGGADLAARKLGAQAAPHLERISKAAEQTAKIVRNLLQFARVERPTREPTDINALIEGVLDLTSNLLTTHRIAVARSLQPTLPTTYGDPSRLQQVVLNLVMNADQAMSENGRGGTLTVRTGVASGLIRIEVADMGPGIPPALRGRIFDPYFTTKPIGSGTGLGLSVAYGIVTAHGGRIWLEDTAGPGATFVVELPVSREDAVGLSESEAHALRSQRVLVVEDEAPVAEILSELFRMIGCSVRVVSSTVAARAVLAEERFDLVTLDLVMASEGGAALWSTLRDSIPEMAARVAFVTGAVEPDLLSFLESTGRPVLTKPFTLGGLMQLLRSTGHN